MQFDPPGGPGPWADDDPLNQPALLVYAEDPCRAGCWLGEPIDFRAGAADPGFWVLRLADPRTWVLVLRGGGRDVVTYRLRTPAGDDGSFPITLRRAGPGGGESVNWPSTVTLTPA